jgi:transposase
MSVSNTTKRVKEIRRKTRRKFSSEEKIRIVLEGLRGESSIAELCRREGINSNLYYRWSKDFLEAGKRRLAGDTVREANTDGVVGLNKDNKDLNQAAAVKQNLLEAIENNELSLGEVVRNALPPCLPTTPSGLFC